MGQHFTDELFHFVGGSHPTDDDANLTTLQKVLTRQWITHPPHEEKLGPISLTLNLEESLVSGKLLVPEVVCFCDIPLEHLAEHATKYGRFGISLKKSYCTERGMRPVMYIPTFKGDRLSMYGSSEVTDIEAAYKGFERHLLHTFGPLPGHRDVGKIPSSSLEAVNTLETVFKKSFLAFLKVFDSDLPSNDAHYYYSEKEWRRLGNISFPLSAVVQVVVAPGFAAPLLAKLPQYSGKVIELG